MARIAVPTPHNITTKNEVSWAVGSIATGAVTNAVAIFGLFFLRLTLDWRPVLQARLSLRPNYMMRSLTLSWGVFQIIGKVQRGGVHLFYVGELCCLG